MRDCIVQDRDSIVALDVSESGRGDLRDQGYCAYRLKVLRQDHMPHVEFDVWAMRRPSDEIFWKVRDSHRGLDGGQEFSTSLRCNDVGDSP